MASVERAMAKAAGALLPALLPTPPWTITPSPCIIIIILPAASNPKFPKPGRADSVESSTSPGRANSADRWDAHKKPRAAARADADQPEQKTSIVVDKEAPEDETKSKKMIATAARTQLVFSGPSFIASPEPSMIPMPTFLPRRHTMIPLPAFVQARS
ncbi:hypothetical protein BRADI_1g27943v3 [Brachypodium distachyon]|uniref:Uncharacterized protein n=1 Tax=Brachypodium distachyon TaxID=15368 RepID=A0A2K2DLH4_BRADI|nr:hypothetical protein BRADI_1g27943v3 [Brachypodium distachyon]